MSQRQSTFDRLLAVLRRRVRFRELDADQSFIDEDTALATRLWAALDPEVPDGVTGSAMRWPVELWPVAEELGFLAAEDLRGPGLPAAPLGASPSALSDGDPGAQVQREAGYEVTDLAGLFRGAGPFLVTVCPGSFTLHSGAEVTAAGRLRVRSGQLCTFDPMDSAYLDRTVQRLDRAVPPGEHPVHVAHWRDTLGAALVLFGGAPVHGWAPVRFDADRNPMPVPPILPMAQVRYAVGLCDSTTMDELLAAATRPQTRREENVIRSILGQPPLGPGDPPSGAVVHETPAALDGLLEGLRRRSFAHDGGLFGARAEGPLPASWGLDERGAVVALALDFGALRIARPDSELALSLAELVAAPEGLWVHGYRVSADANGDVVASGAGDGTLNGVDWAQTVTSDMAGSSQPRHGPWTRSVREGLDWGSHEARFGPPPGEWTHVRLCFASPSRAGVLLERRSLARRLCQRPPAPPAETPSWELAGSLGGLLKRWCEIGDAGRIEQGLARVPLARALPLQRSERAPVRPEGASGICFDLADRVVTITRAAPGDLWRIQVAGRPVVTVLRESKTYTTNAATYEGDLSSPRLVEGLPIAGDALLELTELQVRRDVEGLEAKAMWGGRIGEVFGTAVYEVHHLNLVFSEDFSMVQATLSVHDDTSS